MVSGLLLFGFCCLIVWECIGVLLVWWMILGYVVCVLGFFYVVEIFVFLVWYI